MLKLLDRPPSLLTFLTDSIISGVIAWMIPTGVNGVFTWIGINPPIPPQPMVSVLAFFTSMLFLYGFQTTRWVSRGLDERLSNIEDSVRSTLQNESRQIWSESAITQLLASYSSQQNFKDSNSRHFRDWVKAIEECPEFMEAGAHVLGQWQIDEWRRSIDVISSTGIEMSLDRQMQLVTAYLSLTRDYLLTDPVVYSDVVKDWTPAWKEVLRWAGTLEKVNLEYVIVASPENKQGVLDETRLLQMRQLAKFLEESNFNVFYCDPSLLLDTDPDTRCLEQLTHFFDSEVGITMPITRQFTGAKRILTSVKKCDNDMCRFRENIVKFRKPVSTIRRPSAPRPRNNQ